MLLCISVCLVPSKNIETYSSCKHLVHIGDSTSVPIVKQLKTKYESIGFNDVHISVGNGRSLVYSQKPDTMSGINAINYYRRKLGSGICWVIALGTNDAASTQRPDDSTRIDLTMEAINGDRVVWINVWMNSSRPGYNIYNSKKWNTLLSNKLKIYSHAYIVNWAAISKGFPQWFSDGYHYTNLGYKKRSEYIPINVAYLLMP